ncbi:MAG: hypothetical protein KME17_15310 [Cyanosarcina radialis HA8281-LM2]|jgi:uncharacterized lipoprotein YmbA|nr:hypothetical protein [Cyanosarcina radialis HA8281-LM2]
MSVRENFRLSDKESAILAVYCQQEDRTKTDVVRELVRSLEDKLSHKSKQLLANISKPNTG